MSDEPTSPVEELFHQAAALPPQQRERFLADCCGRDDRLRARLALLLAAHDPSDGFLAGGAQPPTIAIGLTVATGDLTGVRVGRYQIRRLIGSGGMGSVYEAEQEDPRRSVALKLIRPALASQQLLRRFHHEAQILGQLHHPGIAQIYEAGVADVEWSVVDGQRPALSTQRMPFFAMELIQGRPIDRYVRDSGIGVRPRFDLFAKVCDAVHYAHQKGVIHRDLKPGNILVDEFGQPKILDFGVARVTNADVQATIQTDVGQLIGTLAYMSPEQVAGRPEELDLRSDVYALGVVLYELVAGKPPYKVGGHTIPEAVRVIREEEPSRLSLIDTRFRGDVETIVAKALEKDKARRYTSAAELAADIRRYLTDEPIVARPASRFYQLRKFARRKRGLVTGLTAAFLILVVGVIGTTTSAVRATRQRDRAQVQQRRAEDASYRATLSAAAAALREHDSLEAVARLQSVPADQRGWEWRHFQSRIDQSAGRLKLAPGYTPRVLLNLRWEDGGRTVAALGTHESFRYIRWDAESGEQLSDGDLEDGCFPVRNAADTAEFWLGRDGCFYSRDGRTHQSQKWRLADLQAADVPDLPASDFAPVVTLSDDGRWALIRQRARYWTFDLTAGRLRGYTLMDDNDAFLALRLSRSTPHLAVTLSPELSMNPAIVNLETGEVTPLRGSMGAVMTFDFSPDGQRLASAGRDTHLRLWDVQTGAPIGRAAGHTAPIETVKFSSDGRQLVSYGLDGTIRVWDAATLECRTVWSSGVSALKATPPGFSPDGRWVLSYDEFGFRLWDASAPGNPCILRGHTSYVYPVAVAPDGTTIASAGWDNSVRLWDLASGAPVAELRGHTGWVGSLAFSPDGLWLASADTDYERWEQHTVHIWNLQTGKLLAVRAFVGERCPEIAFHRRELHVLISTDYAACKAIIWNVGDDQCTEEPLTAVRDYAAPQLSHDASLLALEALGRDPYTPRPTTEVRVVALPERRILWEVAGITTYRPSVVFSPPTAGPPRVTIVDGQRGRPDTVCVRILDAWSGTEVAVLRGHTDAVYTVAWSPDGKRLATGGRDNVIRIWDTATFQEIAQLRGHEAYVWSLAWTPDGERLISGSGDSTVRIWETQPPATRLRAREERRVMVAELAPSVSRLFDELGDAAGVVARLRADPSLTGRRLAVALQVALNQAVQRGSAAPPGYAP